MPYIKWIVKNMNGRIGKEERLLFFEDSYREKKMLRRMYSRIGRMKIGWMIARIGNIDR